jgi:hypothetical protein
MNMNFVFLTRPQDDELVVSFLGGSRLFPVLIKPNSDFDMFSVYGKFYEGWLANLNLSLSDRHIMDLFIPDDYIKSTSVYWQQLESQRNKLLTRPRLTRVTRSFLIRIERSQDLHGKSQAELIKRAWQVLALAKNEDVFSMPSSVSDVLVALRGDDTSSDEKLAMEFLNTLYQDLKTVNLTIFPEDDLEVRLV